MRSLIKFEGQVLVRGIPVVVGKKSAHLLPMISLGSIESLPPSVIGSGEPIISDSPKLVSAEAAKLIFRI